MNTICTGRVCRFIATLGVMLSAMLFGAACSNAIIPVGEHRIAGNLVFCGEPYAGPVTVTLENARFGNQVTESDNAGTFSFDRLWDGEYRISFTSSAVEFNPSTVTVNLDGADVSIDGIDVIISWERTIASAYPVERLTSLLPTDDYGYVAVGRQGDDEWYRAIIVKYDRYGNLLWSRRLEGSDNTGLHSLVRTDAGFAAQGVTLPVNNYSGLFSVFFPTAYAGGESGVEIRTPYRCAADTNTYPSQFSAASWTTGEGTDTRIYTAGSTDAAAAGITDFLITERNATGAVSRIFRDDAGADARSRYHAITGSGGYLYAAGSVEDDSTDQPRLALSVIRTADLTLDETVSDYTFVGYAASEGKSITFFDDGDLALAVSLRETVYGGVSGCVLRMRNTRERVWMTFPESSARWELLDIKSDGAGGVLCAGMRYGNDGEYHISEPAACRIGADGTVLWTSRFPGSGTVEEKALSIYPTRDGGCVLAGLRGGPGSNKEDMLIIKLNRNGAVYRDEE